MSEPAFVEIELWTSLDGTVLHDGLLLRVAACVFVIVKNHPLTRVNGRFHLDDRVYH